MEPFDYSRPPQPVMMGRRRMPRVIVVLLVLCGITCLGALGSLSYMFYRVQTEMDQLNRDLGRPEPGKPMGED